MALRKSIVLLRNEQKTLPLKTATKVYFETYYDKGQGKSPITVNKPAVAGLEFVDKKEDADVVLLWLIPTSGGLFNNSYKEIDIRLSANRINVQHVNELINSKPTIVAINYSNPWVIEEIDFTKASVLATFGTTQDALLDVVR